MDALAGKSVLLVTHQVDFLPAFDSVLVNLILYYNIRIVLHVSFVLVSDCSSFSSCCQMEKSLKLILTKNF